MTGTLMVGVSGVRGIVGKDLTPDVVTRWAAAFGTWAADARREAGGGSGRPTVVVGRDARTSGPMFAKAAIEAVTAVGCDVIDLGLVPTPTVQLAVRHHRAAGGIVITASHNPIEWNALKFAGPDGIFLDADAGARVRELAERGGAKAGSGERGAVSTDGGAIERHLAGVLGLPGLDVQGIRGRRFTVALDTVRGAGGAIMPALLERLGCRVAGIHLNTDGRFPRSPEPVPEHLGELGERVGKTAADLGFAVDPDVDRLAIVDETGTPIGEDYTLAFAVRAVLGGGASRRPGGQSRRPTARPPARPTVVCNLSTSLIVEDAARECGAVVVRTPVGEAHVAREIVRREAVIGGEGNGGVMYPALHVGRDAPVAAALVLALLRRTGKRVSEVVAGAPRYAIVKAKVPGGPGGPALEPVYGALRRCFADAQVDAQDGLRLAWRDRWLHVRPSNTEPIIRLIAEAPTGAEAERLVDEGRRLCAAS